jgi:hypothetical protein
MSTTDTRWHDEPLLSPDFAARVLRRADTIRTRRRRLRGAMTAAAGALLVALVVGPRIVRTPAPNGAGALAANSSSGSDFLAEFDAARGSSGGNWSSALAGNSNGDADALNYLLPDAAPLARFANEYSAAGSGTDTDDEAFTSGDAADEGDLL